MRILVLGGGDGPERDVSLRSASAVRDGLTDSVHDVRFCDPAGGEAALRLAVRQCDLIFPILHGVGGEDGSIQRLLDDIGKPYLGSGEAVSRLCFDKPRLKQLLVENGISTPKSEVVTAETFGRSQLTQAPFVLKPIGGGSSLDIMIARAKPFDIGKAQGLLEKYDEMLLEELILGDEITVPVLGDSALPVIEIVPPEGKEFDYENKYNGATSELCPPRNISAEVQKQAQRLAERVHALSGARHLSRTDIMIDRAGTLYVLEINTLPGMTAQSLFPKSAAQAGLPWTALMERLVDMAKG